MSPAASFGIGRFAARDRTQGRDAGDGRLVFTGAGLYSDDTQVSSIRVADLGDRAMTARRTATTA